jgi:hypothetical protein
MAVDWGAGSAADAARGCGIWVLGRRVGSGCLPDSFVGRPGSEPMVVFTYQEARLYLSVWMAAVGAGPQNVHLKSGIACVHESGSGFSRCP